MAGVKFSLILLALAVLAVSAQERHGGRQNFNYNQARPYNPWASPYNQARPYNPFLPMNTFFPFVPMYSPLYNPRPTYIPPRPVITPPPPVYVPQQPAPFNPTPVNPVPYEPEPLIDSSRPSHDENLFYPNGPPQPHGYYPDRPSRPQPIQSENSDNLFYSGEQPESEGFYPENTPAESDNDLFFPNGSPVAEGFYPGRSIGPHDEENLLS